MALPYALVGGTVALAYGARNVFQKSTEQAKPSTGTAPQEKKSEQVDNLLYSTDFWAGDNDAVLMQRSANMFEQGSGTISEASKRAQQWLDLAQVDRNEPVEFIEVDEYERIFVKDAERTFVSEVSKKRLMKILHLCQTEFGDYQQSLSFVASFLMLTLDEKNVVRLLRKLNYEYIPKHWKGVADGMSVNAYLFQRIAKQHCPEVVAHLEASGILPDTYIQRWFAGLTVHLMPFPPLFRFFDLFMEYKDEFLIKFGISFFTEMKNFLLNAHAADAIYEIMRFEPYNKAGIVFDSALMSRIVENAMKIEFLEDHDFPALKEEISAQVRAKLEKAAQAPAAEKIEECELCPSEDDKGFLDYFCVDCKKYICSDCHDDEVGTHLSEHSVKEYDPDDDEDDEGGVADEIAAVHLES